MQLLEKIGKTNIIHKVEAQTLAAAIKIAFTENKYNFYLNSELIDINNRFRIFNFNGVNYLIKKSKKKDAFAEVDNANKVKSSIGDENIDGYEIDIVVPQLINDGDECFLVTEYLGHSVQEILYTNRRQLSINMSTLSGLLKLFDRRQILYRGLLPRNMIIKNNTIHLIDWEDVIIKNKPIEMYYNLQFKTNFVLNWGYIFPNEQLVDLINSMNIAKVQIEPPLNKYEEVYYKCFNMKTIHEIRELIYKIVLSAEKPYFKDVETLTEKFVILPNDMAHLISDLFTNEIDVLFDILAFGLREKDEGYYAKLVASFSDNIINMYKNAEIDRSKLFLYVLSMCDLSLKDKLDYSVNYHNLKNFVLNSSKDSIAYAYLMRDFKSIRRKLRHIIKSCFQKIDSRCVIDTIFIDKIVQQIKYLRNDLENGVVYEDDLFVVQESGEFFVPRLYELFYKKKHLSNEEQLKLAKLQWCMRKCYLELGILQVSIYNERVGLKQIVKFIPFYQKKLKSLNINPDDYQLDLVKYLKSYSVDDNKKQQKNEMFGNMLVKRLREYERV